MTTAEQTAWTADVPAPDRMRLTLANRPEMIAWLGDDAHEPDDPGSDVVIVDAPEGRVVIVLGETVERTATGFRKVPRTNEGGGHP